ncbi:hypothetical protein MYU51_008370 [Penicillium brevicompactum]|uniref:uncharacterized protein n=1 Tax=Penicillium brevicompactum TaxID=5074 RepID=UPI002540CCFA|nr:uncharacterized protein N7506_010200 [Penicillium brevicompactum]KAJ5327098.1 hypothetical protein N7506_010200 [Penicillium brevicompactum]
MAPKQAKPDSRAATLFFKKHKTTVLLMLQTHETLESAKDNLLQALKSRSLNDINGDPVPDDSFDIELGVPVDRADLEKGWRSLEADDLVLDEESAPKKNKGKSKKQAPTLLEAGITDGNSIAFRFHKYNEAQNGDRMDLDAEDPGWDVIVPSYADDEL